MLGKLNESEINELLQKQTVGRIGCYAEGLTYVVPVTYIYENNCIIGHIREGQKVKMMRANPSVCFEVDEVKSMGNWKSVIIQGFYREIEGEEAYSAFSNFFEKIRHLLPSSTAHPHDKTDRIRVTDIKGSIIFKIRILEKTGRFETSE
jgi:uncharacterized protein